MTKRKRGFKLKVKFKCREGIRRKGESDGRIQYFPGSGSFWDRAPYPSVLRKGRDHSPRADAKRDPGVHRGELGQLEMALCLKSTGMPLKDIKRYFDLVEEGDETLEERLRIFQEHRVHVLEGIEELKKHLEKINCKISYLKSLEGK